MASITYRTPQGINRTFHHRATVSDNAVIKQVFMDKDYAFTPLRRGAELTATGLGTERALIIDAGANIGASVCWFAMFFPDSHIVAFEPDADNFRLLQQNTAGLNVELHQAALGSRDGMVRLLDLDLGEMGYRTERTADGDIPIASISRIVAEKCAAGFNPFVAKIDIEGGEADLFSPPTDWVDQFPLIVVELHDWFMPKQGTSRSFLQCIAARDRDFVHIRENIFSIRND